MKKIRKLLSFLTIFCCLAGSIIQVSAAAAPRVTFTNKPRNAPDLYVTKRVTGAPAQNQYDLFSFVLKINGEVAANQPYRVFQLDDLGGKKEIARMVAKNGNEDKKNELPFATDESGVFTLEANQQAYFEYIGTGVKYEVIELDTYQKPRTTVDSDGKEQIVYNTKDGYWIYERIITTSTGADGEEVQKVEYGKEPIRREIQYRTYQLKAGGYSKASPSGGTTGQRTMPFNGASVEFTNAYSTTGDLVVRKTISFPTTWKAPVTEDFLFEIKINGKPYNGEEYTAVNEATGETLTGRTTAEGYFTLKGGWKATFENVPDNSDYRITERKGETPEEVLGTVPDAGSATGTKEVKWPEGWWPTTAATQYGTTPPKTPVEFNNANLSFIVTKKLDDNSKPDVNFNFRLIDSQNNGIAGAKYYLYKTTGEPVSWEELSKQKPGVDLTQYQRTLDETTQAPLLYTNDADQKEIVTGTTKSDGSFTLRAGQAAVFVGIQPGTTCTVTETGTTNYVQVLPEQTEPYTVDNKGAIHMIEFTNRAIEPGNGTLTVLKNVENEGGEGSLDKEKDFHFILYKRLKDVNDFMQFFDVTVTEADRTAPEAGKAPAWWEKLSAKWRAVLREVEYPSSDAEVIAMAEAEGAADISNFLIEKVKEELARRDNDPESYKSPEGNYIKVLAPTTEGNGTGQGSGDGTGENPGNNSGQNTATTPGLEQLDDFWYKEDSQTYALYLPVENASYDVQNGLSLYNYATGPGQKEGLTMQPGEFTLKADQTAQFKSLTVGGQYMVREIGLTSEYSEYNPAYVQANPPAGTTGNGTNTEIGTGSTTPGTGTNTGTTTTPGSGTGAESTTTPGAGTDISKYTEILPQGGAVVPPTSGTVLYAQTAQLPQSGLAFTFTNIYKAEKVDLTLYKINDEEEPRRLAGAQFMLYLQEGRQQEHKYLPQDLQGMTPEEFCYTTTKACGPTCEEDCKEHDATVTISDLKLGTYWLYETKAPSGYSLLKDPVKIEVTRAKGGENDGQLQVFINGQLYAVGTDTKVSNSIIGRVSVTDRTTDTTPQTTPTDPAQPATSTTTDTTGTKAQIGLTILNIELYELPNSGGIGIYWYSIGGVLLMMAAALILYRKNTRGRC